MKLKTPPLSREIALLEERAIDEKELTVDIIASTPMKDSHGTIVQQSGWDTSRFKKNPVINWAHDDRGKTLSGGLPVANALPETVRIEDGKLKMKVRFTPEDVNPFGYRVFKLVKAGFLHGLSVGFMVMERDMIEDADGDMVPVFKRMELLEVSFVSIPSNPETLVERAAAAGMEVKEAMTLIQEVEAEAERLSHEDCENEYCAKTRKYFEDNQQANRESTKVLKRLYKIWQKKDAEKKANPSLLTAWRDLDELLDELEEMFDPSAPKTLEQSDKGDVLATKPPVQKTSEPAPKNSVLLSFSELGTLSAEIQQKVVDHVIENLKRGEPEEDLDRLLKEATEAILKDIPSLTSSFSHS